MSFDFDPNINLSNVQASHKPTDGGGGNTGYFQRNTEENEETSFHFRNNNECDSFNLSMDSIIDEEKNDEDGIFDKIINFIKKILEKIKTILKQNKK